MNTENMSWKLFELSGSIEAYLNYKECEDKEKKEEAASFGSCENGGNCNERS